jgi:hypothetical protein
MPRKGRLERKECTVPNNLLSATHRKVHHVAGGSRAVPHLGIFHRFAPASNGIEEFAQMENGRIRPARFEAQRAFASHVGA